MIFIGGRMVFRRPRLKIIDEWLIFIGPRLIFIGRPMIFIRRRLNLSGRRMIFEGVTVQLIRGRSWAKRRWITTWIEAPSTVAYAAQPNLSQLPNYYEVVWVMRVK